MREHGRGASRPSRPADLPPSRNHPGGSAVSTTFHSRRRRHELNSFSPRGPGLDSLRVPPEERRGPYPTAPGSRKSVSLFRAIGRPLRLAPAPTGSLPTHAVWRLSGPPDLSTIRCRGAIVPAGPWLFPNPLRLSPSDRPGPLISPRGAPLLPRTGPRAPARVRRAHRCRLKRIATGRVSPAGLPPRTLS